MKRFTISVFVIALTLMLMPAYAFANELPMICDHTASTTWFGDNTYHWHECTSCGKVMNKAEHSWDEGRITTEPTYAKAGVKTFTCTVCKATRTESIDKLTTKDNSISINPASKAFKRSKLKKKKSFTMTVSNAGGQVTYKMTKSAKKAKIKVKQLSYNTSGSGADATATVKYKITVPKKCKKGTYKITVKAAGNDSYKAGEKVLKIKVK